MPRESDLRFNFDVSAVHIKAPVTRQGGSSSGAVLLDGHRMPDLPADSTDLPLSE